jgi:hypothetical protein
VFRSSGGIEAIGSGSTRVVDLVLEFRRFGIREVEEVVTRSRESWTPDSRSPDRVRTVRSWENRAVDLQQGYIMISAIDDGTCCILVRRYMKSRGAKRLGPRPYLKVTSK